MFDPYAMTHDNRYLAVGSDMYLNGFTGANGTFKQGYSAILIDLLDKKKIYMVGNGCWPFTPPAGNFVYHIRRDDNGDNPSWPDIYRLDLADLDTRRSYEPEVANPDADWGHEYHPHISNDNKWLIYMTSNGCHWDYSCNNEIFLHRLGTGTSDRIRVTDHPSFDGFPDLFVGPMWQKSNEPQLATAPRHVTFHARAATMPDGQTIRIKNVGGGDLGEATAMFDPPVRWADARHHPDGDHRDPAGGSRHARPPRGHHRPRHDRLARGAAAHSGHAARRRQLSRSKRPWSQTPAWTERLRAPPDPMMRSTRLQTRPAQLPAHVAVARRRRPAATRRTWRCGARRSSGSDCADHVVGRGQRRPLVP